MKLCKKCGNKVETRIVVNGKKRELRCRRYCLSCSPYNAHNTRQLEVPKTSNAAKSLVCEQCNRSYVYDLANKQGHRMDICNTCAVNGRRFALKDRCIAYKGRACKRCGYKRCTKALVFHHRDPALKELSISGSHCRKWSTLQAELDKCDMLCANCHAEVHAEIDSKRRDPSRNG